MLFSWHCATHILKNFDQSPNQLSAIRICSAAEKSFHHPTERLPRFFFLDTHFISQCIRSYSCNLLSNEYSSFYFGIREFWKHPSIFLKASPSTSKALTNCFTDPNLIWRGGNKTFSRATRASWMILCFPGVKQSWNEDRIYRDRDETLELRDRDETS